MANKKEQTNEAAQGAAIEICNIPVAQIHPSDDNPRSDIDEESVKELAESIRIYGILQPVTIRPDEDYGTEESPWVMVSGHRRLVACKMLGLETIPAIIRDDISDDKAYDIMIVENLQRKDLTPLDEAVAYKALIDAYPTTGYEGTSVQELAARFGKSEKYIKGRLSLNELVPELKDCLKAGSLTIGAAVSLSSLPMDQQLEFLKDYGPVMSEADKETVISPMSISDVKNFIEDTSDRIKEQSFAEDVDETWNRNLHKCAGCPFNSASQGALFVDMVEPGVCSNESCLNDKILAYARHIFDYWLPNFKPADSHLEAGDVVLFVEKQPWFGRAAREGMEGLYDSLRHQADELGSFNPNKTGGRIWNTEPDNPELKNAIRVLNLAYLVAGRTNYMEYYRLPKQSSNPLTPQEPTHSDIYRRLGALYDKRQEEIYKALEPMSKAAIETWFNTDDEAQISQCHLPPFLEDFVAYHLINEMSWQSQRDLIGSDTSLNAVRRFMTDHCFSEVVKAALMDRIENGQSYYRPYLMQLVMEGCAEGASADVIEEICNKYQPKVDKLIQQLRDMGYDEYDHPLQTESDDSDEADNNEQES